ncbi:MAG: hypothetical protein HKN23_06530 [Verrucomicrobiales bacterium]|nr:hypothetical protein [Verrucomicrobiales bacterium]
MNFSRRHFVKQASCAAAGSSAGLVAIGQTEREDATPLQIGLRAWMNTLLPPDDFSPGAGDLGVHFEIEQHAKSIHNYELLLQRGMKWADDQVKAMGKADFAALDDEDRVKIIEVAEADEAENSVPRQFFFHTLRDGVNFYYGHSESWPGIGFPHPPQPIGFPDYARAPDTAP